MYALIVESTKNGHHGTVMTREGEKFLVCNTEWVEATGCSLRGKPKKGHFLKETKVFKTESAAKKFAERWEGHPWYCKPNGNYEIIEVEPIVERVIVGFKKIGLEKKPRGKTILYSKRVRGCYECPSCFIHPYDKAYDRCRRCGRKNGYYVYKRTWPRWCPLLKKLA